MISLHQQQCDNVHKIQQEMARQSGAVFACVASLTCPLGSPLCMCTTIFGGEQSSAHHEVAGCCGVRWCGIHCSSVSSEKHWVNWGCVSLDQWNILYKSARVHAFVTMAWFRFLDKLPLPQSHCRFLTQTAAVHNVFTYITWCKPPHFLLR